jgi:hypothetical protein
MGWQLQAIDLGGARNLHAADFGLIYALLCTTKTLCWRILWECAQWALLIRIPDKSELSPDFRVT